VDIDIRTIAEDEFEAWMHAIETAFGGHVRPEDLELERSVLDPARCLAAIDEGEIVGCASSVIFTMTVPGGATVPTVGVTGVGVKPTHRRRGVNTGLMRRQLDDAHKSAQPVAALYASEGGIYGRFGYGLGSLSAATDLETARSAFVPGSETTGRVRLLERDAARDPILDVYDRARLNRPGAMAMDATWFDYQFADKQHGEERHLFFAVHDTGGGADGFAAYTIKSEWGSSVPKNELELYALDALTPDAYASMWRFVLDVDLVQRVTAWGRPSDEPLFHLLREPRRLNLRIKDALWVRLVDLPAALAVRRYAVEGRLVFEVRDAFCSWNDGRYELDAGPDGASCRPTGEAADLVLTVNELAAAYLGGPTFLQLHRAGRVHEERPGALGLADAMFRWDPAPWCPLFF
jgi:predicted acetyltransferase